MAAKRATISETEALSGTEAFGQLSEDDLREIQQIADVVTFREGTLIFERGDPGDMLYAVISGRVDIRTTWVDGREIKLNIHGAGHVIGEIGAIDGKARTAAAVAASDASLLRIRRADLLSFLDAKPGRWNRMAILLCERIRWTSDRIEANAFLDVPRRLAHRIIVLAQSHGRPTTGGVAIDPIFTQDELAQMIGASRESTNKALRHLTNIRAIRQERGRIIVLSMAALRDFTDSFDD